ncbi:hypothetical protein [Photobacterium sp.]|uniref:hypothetical protein n=1 Tax=Photobacterium sp. TaxID=660 RepID=UPI00299CE8C7|nr:hypothetical protein [Photobacterium sp.]MDX1303432.1 hypothetical protein [Photobacterium sp.]
MHNLTKEQKNVLEWLKQGHTFDVCSEYCSMQGKVILSHPLTTRIIHPTICKLRREGLIKYHEIQKYGVRWDRFSITLKGKMALC